MKRYPRIFGFETGKQWEFSNTKIKLMDEYDPYTYQPFYLTSVGPCRIWWEWRGMKKS